jgi:ectoine hydroxylase-related dioxygenase (phytanoyl-CoA dioxygenase family)
MTSSAVAARATAPTDLERLPFGASPTEVAAILARDGALVLQGALTPEQVAKVNGELDAQVAELAEGNFDDGEGNFIGAFNGRKTKRLQHCVKYSPTYRDAFVASPVLAEYISLILPGAPGSHSLFSSQGIEIFPGEKRQYLHRDGGRFDELLGLDRLTGVNILANTLLALTDITEEMGATRVIPGSHLWEDQSNAGAQEETVPATMSAGDVFLFNGRVSHGGGANVTRDRSRRLISTAFSLGFVRGEEAWPFVISVAEARDYPAQVQKMMGFRSLQLINEEPGFLWRAHTRPLEEHLRL